CRRRNVNRLFEERAVQRIRFVEDCKDPQDAVGHDAFEREFASRDVGLDEDLVLESGAGRPDLGPREQGSDPIERGTEPLGLVGAYDAAAPRQSDWFEYTRIASPYARRGRRILVGGHHDILRGWQSGGRQGRPGPPLVP